MAVPQTASQDRSTQAARGVIAVLFGLAVLLWPEITLGVLVYLFGILALVMGIFFIVGAFQDAENHQQWWLQAIKGGLGILIGLFVLFGTSAGTTILFYVVAFWAIITGIPDIIAGFRAHDWIEMGYGVVLAIFGIILITYPGRAALSVVWIIGMTALIYGGLVLVRAFRSTPTTH
ncbi:MAG TPA: DUF308 domain-containing protein [Chloroflexota bacterium]|nr:DUF308 domain-containing protein [Chloroflexota bacterium]